MIYKNSHRILAVILFLVFQLPGWMLLEHSFHQHDRIHICEAEGFQKHLHQKSDENCGFLHDKISFNYAFEIFEYVSILRLDFFPNPFSHILEFSLKLVLFSKLRAPPIQF